MNKELPSTAIRTGLRFAASLGIGLTSVLSPIEERPKPVQADQPFTLLHDGGSKDRLNIMLLPYIGTTTQMLQEVAEDIFLIPPTDEFKNRVNVYTTTPLEDLKCDQNASCEGGAVKREIDRVVAAGIVPHETMIVIKSNELFRGAGLAITAPRALAPDIYTFSAMSIPVNARRSEHSRIFYASGIAHELWGHAFAGFDHEGGDIMDNSIQGPERLKFNPQHTQFLRSLMALSPYNYNTPKNGVNATTGSLSLKVELTTPTGTTQQKRRITPANNDGPAITLLRNQEGFFEVPVPQIGVGNYILLPDMSYTWKEWSSNHPTALVWDSPKWDSFEGWPGVFFPNTPAEIKVKTPKRFSDGITAFSPQNGAVVVALRPLLSWVNKDVDVFYYEIRASKDCTFNTDPDTATAPVWHNLIHGGKTKPINAWQTPQLEMGTEYCWGARPRIQGDGTPVEWSQTFRFKTASSEGVKAVSGVIPDLDYGNGILGPSAYDMERWGKLP